MTPQWRRCFILSLLVAAHLANNMVLVSYHSFPNFNRGMGLPQLLYTILASQVILLGAWIAFGNGNLPLRMVWAVCLYLFLQMLPAQLIDAVEHWNYRFGPVKLASELSMMVGSALLFLMIRRQFGWRWKLPEQIDSGANERFTIRRLLWGTFCLSIAFALSSRVLAQQESTKLVTWTDSLYNAITNSIIGLMMAPFCLPLIWVAMEPKRTWLSHAALLSAFVSAVTLLQTSNAGATLGLSIEGVVVLVAALFGSVLVSLLLVRWSGYRLVTRWSARASIQLEPVS